jgi:hypothetical protein
MFAYAIARYVDLPSWFVRLEIVGIYLPLEINVNTWIAIVVAGVTVSGTDWLLRTHPQIGNQSTFQHWLLPGLTAWIISIPLNNLPISPTWWTIFAVGGIVLLLVLSAEFIVVDPQDIRFPPAALVLSTLSYILFLILAISLSAISQRLLFTLPPISLATGLVSLRTIKLRLGSWQFPLAFSITLITSQVAAVLHYLPVSPVTFGLILLGITYALTDLLVNLAQEQSLRKSLIEPLIVLIVILIIAFWFI